MAPDVNSAHRARWKYFLLPRRYNRTAGESALIGCAGDVRFAVSARSRTKHFSKGPPRRDLLADVVPTFCPPPPSAPGTCGDGHPAPVGRLQGGVEGAERRPDRRGLRA